MYIENAKLVCHRKSELQNMGVHREFLKLGSYIHTAAKTNINHQIVSKHKAACTVPLTALRNQFYLSAF